MNSTNQRSFKFGPLLCGPFRKGNEMMYNSRLACAIKVGGKVLREFNKDTVFLPFGCEYSLLVKNLNSVRTIVNITIDGQEVVTGGLVVNAYQEVEIERFVKTNLNKGNKFKFIERSDAVEAHRGVKLEDGVIRIEYQFEKTYPTPLYYVSPTVWYGSGSTWTGDILAGSATTGAKETLSSNSILRSAAINSIQCSATSSMSETPSNFVEQGYNDAGITVPGSESNQQFTKVSGFPVEYEKHVMIFKLLGETPDNEPIRKPVTVKHKPKCVTCSKQNKANAKFCSTCGTALQVLA